jgi:hypothetical protein
LNSHFDRPYRPRRSDLKASLFSPRPPVQSIPWIRPRIGFINNFWPAFSRTFFGGAAAPVAGGFDYSSSQVILVSRIHWIMMERKLGAADRYKSVVGGKLFLRTTSTSPRASFTAILKSHSPRINSMPLSALYSMWALVLSMVQRSEGSSTREITPAQPKNSTVGRVDTKRGEPKSKLTSVADEIAVRVNVLCK